ncbi:hypothetical protein PTSG_09335 [Salpingoeca rosetta]|uniref:Peptidase S54 rhomboid domain-containing protein n=1 Tax=Salpingoeca rosetta (strain ATCC 50818 / BSB-021) TaxID=946362 RepID=F2UMC1_SALR5|nr:uncharacterized protein PTSG_09335 [Salpingoeca rosetta]EGD78270.1 hypothetical protein PTSG_09335 [Salpingoeca rosetta]|eukprot:XP_004989593.1 hypothetical protein PTSG_09335 [Salpingoeca rosetta]
MPSESTPRPQSAVQRRLSLMSARGKRLAHLIIQNKEDIQTLRTYRPYFTYWAVFVQSLCLIVALSVFDRAPIDYRTKEVSGQVYRPDGVPVSVTKNLTGNIFIGPTTRRIIGMGGAYGPCMRRDDAVNNYVDHQRAKDDDFGCCVRVGGQYCFSTTEQKCSELGGQRFYNDTVCHGQYCCNGGTWPGCSRVPEENLSSDPKDDVCRCEVTARPCCYGVFGECSIKTQSECDFLDGYFHSEAVSCREVDCLNSICQLGKFANKYIPDQWYRLILAPFVPVGAVHHLVFLLAQLSLGVPLERAIGWTRLALIYLVSAIGGYTIAIILAPYQVKAGPSPGVYGLLACLLLQLFESWKQVVSPGRELFKLLLLTTCAFIFGLLPFVDNFSQLAGFVFGIAASFAFLPWQSFTSKSFYRARKRIATIIGLGAVVAMFALAIPMLFTGQTADCPQCWRFNCYDFIKNFCQESQQRVESEYL